MAAEDFFAGKHFLDLGDGPSAPCGVCEVRAVVGQDRVDLVGRGFSEASEEVARDTPCRLFVQFDKGELRCPVDGDEHVQLAFLGAHLGDVDMEVADRVCLEAGFRLLALNIRQAGDVVPLIEAVQARSAQMRDRRL